MAEDLEVTPAAQQLAEEQGVDLPAVEGSGAEGRVTKADVEQAAVDQDPLTRARQEAGQKMPATRKAAESGDPGIHQMIANRHAHFLMGDKAQVEALDQQLRDLGYEV